MSVYVSEFNKESWVTLTEEWDYTRFLDFYNNIMFYTDLKQAAEKDMNREQKLEQQKQNIIGKR